MLRIATKQLGMVSPELLDGMIDHMGGGSWLLGECQRHGCNLKYTEVLPPFPSLEICESSVRLHRMRGLHLAAVAAPPRLVMSHHCGLIQTIGGCPRIPPRNS